MMSSPISVDTVTLPTSRPSCITFMRDATLKNSPSGVKFVIQSVTGLLTFTHTCVGNMAETIKKQVS